VELDVDLRVSFNLPFAQHRAAERFLLLEALGLAVDVEIVHGFLI
jgi:hypothetical protein